MPSNRTIAALPPADKDKVLADLDTLQAKMAFLVDITPQVGENVLSVLTDTPQQWLFLQSLVKGKKFSHSGLALWAPTYSYIVANDAQAKEMTR